MALPDLIELSELLAALGVAPGDLEDQEIEKYEFALKAASQAVRNYTGRTFQLATGTATTRTFEYDGSGYLDIDDAVSVASLTGQYGSTERVLLGDEWNSQPFGAKPLGVYEWIRVAPNAWGIGSPEMGFTRNLDTLYDSLPVTPVLMVVMADWGWSEIPYDVKQALVWTASSLSEDPRPYQSESIEGYSRSRGPQVPTEVIPERALAALASYEKLKV